MQTGVLQHRESIWWKLKYVQFVFVTTGVLWDNVFIGKIDSPIHQGHNVNDQKTKYFGSIYL